MLTVLTWFWKQHKGRTSYQAHHVNIWADMVRRHLSLPHRLACVTDTPEGIDPRIDIIEPPGDFESVSIPTWPEPRPQCLRRIAMFRPDAARIFGERFVCMDTDCVVFDSLDPLFDTDADFKMYRGTSYDRPYNGSMLLMTAGARPQVYERFTPERAAFAGVQYLGSDQAWISYVLGRGEETWSHRDGVIWYESRHNIDAPVARVMFFPGSPKPWNLIREEWIAKHYHADPRAGRCLVLGYSPTLWQELDAALKRGHRRFDAVIASPEAAKYWPGKLLAVAAHDWDADSIVKMHGFSDVVFCGRSEFTRDW